MFGRLRSAKTIDSGARPVEGEVQTCPGLARALERILRDDAKARVLDLGPMCGPTVVYLADRGARVSVEEFRPPAAVLPADGDPGDVAPPPLAIPQPDAAYDLVLAWEHLDFVPPSRIEEFGAELARVTVPGGWVLLFSRDEGTRREPVDGRRGRFKVIADDQLVYQADRGPEAPRWSYPNRDIERALTPLSIQGIQLKTGRMREIAALRRR